MHIVLRKFLAFVLLLVVAVSLSGQVLAQTSECGKKRNKISSALDEVTWRRLNDIYEDVG